MVFIIAECGLNHKGNMDLAKKMISKAKLYGASAVKFQVFDKEDYNDERIKSCWLSNAQMAELKAFADNAKIEFMATPEKPAHVDFLESLGVDKYKVGHNHSLDDALLSRIAKTGKPVFISVSDVFDRCKTRELVSKLGFNARVHYLYCIPKYPPSIRELNLSTIKRFSFEGYSNHCPSILPCVLAVTQTAAIIEVHVMIDYDCVDKAVSVSFKELGQLVRLVRKSEAMLWTF